MRHAWPLLLLAGLTTFAVVSCSAAGGDTDVTGGGGFKTASGEGTSTEAGGHGGSSTSTTFTGSGGQDGGTCSTAKTCADDNVECGKATDGCGGLIDCGICPSGTTCGALVSGKCGKPPCTSKTCADQGINCGPAGDGCGNPLMCGNCSGNDTCGGGGPGVCGHGMCTPTTCQALGFNCGTQSDGCGNPLDCGTCPAGESCGALQPSVCGVAPCQTTTCSAQGIDCGPAGDGCGGVLDCGSCSLPAQCGGQTPSQCGVPSSCTGLCKKQVTCSNPAVTTTISGTVYAPNGTDPLPNVLVYVPNAPVLPFTPGVSCDNCASSVSGDPLVSAVTDTSGNFQIQNVPVVNNLPIVVQTGRWRRQLVMTTINSCQDNNPGGTFFRLPKNQGEGDIPFMAFSTGGVDALECVIRKIGVDDAEFTAPGGGGRINLYEGLHDTTVMTGAIGGATTATSPDETSLWGTQAELNQYDMVLFPCQQNQTTRTSAEQQRIINYANAGGRIFATHFSYIWLYNDSPFSSTAQWDVEQHFNNTSPGDQTGYINQTFPKGVELAEWLQVVHASTVQGQIPLQVIRRDFDNVVAPSQSWMTIHDPHFPGAIMHYTFNTPVGAPAAQQCGRVLFDDFHVENVSDSYGQIFPAECVAGPMTAQEKLLEFMLFDLGSCVTPDQPTCTPTTCAAQNIQCGPAGNGCGALLQCGNCPPGQTCGGGGMPGQCGTPSCNPTSCQAQHIACGPAGDGCGNTLQCGTCPTGQTCGGGGMPGQCGMGTCTKETCASQHIDCGPAGDGCGNLLQCGSCPTGQTCGGGGMPGQCGNECKPETCADQGFNCGKAGDGCGNALDCGMCSAPQTCGGGGKANVCGGTQPG